jgi:hypothetical protein
MVRLLASSLARWLTVAACVRVHFRREEAKFPAKSQNACRLLEGTFRGPRVAGCASTDALRPFNNSVNLEDQNEISFIRETLAASARRTPKEGRSKAAFSECAPESSQENILAAVSGIFWKRRNRQETGVCFGFGFAQRFAAAAVAA